MSQHRAQVVRKVIRHGTHRRMPPLRPWQVVVHTVGRPREAGWESLAAAEYTRRLERGRPPILARTTFYSSSDALMRGLQGLTGSLFVLDPLGEAMESDTFAKLILGALQETARVSFAIGGADGLPQPLRPGCACNSGEFASTVRHLSLSQMTFPHRLARVLLLEQIFRARELTIGSGYSR
ncbi:rlmH [Symbiodinium necroappetens]|uniref:RlmH protein n=1 Tax=Symbiodinium necroappetens TaxID=1628268 RepID=A0A812TBH2_9DINO|nr:rlmH [Symbiodinium necroappetens]